MHAAELGHDQPPSGIIWITGYSGAGKTTVARGVERRLRAQGQQVTYLDGDDLRSIFARRWGYGREDRVELAHVYFRLCSHLAAQGHVVIIAAVAMYAEVRDWVRANIPHSTIAYLDVPREVRVERDARTKRLYSSSGADLEQGYDEPIDADLRIQNHDEVSPDAAARVIVDHFQRQHGKDDADRGKAEHWERYYAARDVAVEPPSPFAHTAEVRFPRRAAVLEVGCGNGRDSVHLSARGHEVTALDASHAAIDLCRKSHQGSGVGFVPGVLTDHAHDWPARFDVLYTRFVLHAMTEAEERSLWSEASRVLRSGALLAIECRSIQDPLAREGEVLSPTERIAGHYRRFIVLEDLVARLEAEGFAIEDIVESAGLAIHGTDDPVVIRAFARRA